MGRQKKIVNQFTERQLAKYVNYVGRFVELFNETANKHGSPIAFSSLSKIKDEISYQLSQLESDIEELLFSFREHSKEEESDNNEVSKSKFIVRHAILHTFPHNIYFDYTNVEEKRFRLMVERLYEKKNMDINIKDRVSRLYKKKYLAEKLLRQRRAVDLILFQAIKDNFPEKLEDFSASALRKEFEEFSKTRGRKYDESAPQHLIQEKVNELSSQERFRNKNGKLKPTTITRELLNNYPDLTGELSERSIFRRVKKAIENMT
jgi:hypothetical protein